MSRTRYGDPYDDPNVDPEDIKYGDYDSELGEGFSVIRFDDSEEDDDGSCSSRPARTCCRTTTRG